MAKHPKQTQPDLPVLTCSIEDSGAFTLHGDGSGKLKLSFDSSQAETVMQLYKSYREKTLRVVFTVIP